MVRPLSFHSFSSTILLIVVHIDVVTVDIYIYIRNVVVVDYLTHINEPISDYNECKSCLPIQIR